MRVLYGVVGEGMGHAIRSKVVLEHLLARGHEVEVMASGRAQTFLAGHFAEVNKIHGLHMISEENRVRRGKTLWSNILAGVAGLPKNIRAYFGLIEAFEPEVVISDFESWTYLYAKAHALPILSIDNMQIINRCAHDPELLEGHRVDFELARGFVKSKLPFCDHYLITSFFHPPVRKENTTLFPPILRREILDARPRAGEHLLVYHTAGGFDALAGRLDELGVECQVYGLRRELTSEQREGNLRFRPFSESGFIEDLATARAVITSAGFTLLGEAVYLHKPTLALPLGRQFEQILNARYLEREGYGLAAASFEELDRRIEEFLARQGEFEAALTGYHQDGNRLLLDGVDRHLERAAAGPR
jgi:uncharacterized protein (TIGR00661 family)